MSTFDNFLYTYLIFLSFMFLIIGMGGPDIFGGDFQNVMTEVNATRQSVLEGESAYAPGYNSTSYTGLQGLFATGLGWISDTIGISAWFETNLTPFHNFVSNIWIFFQMAYAEAAVGWLTTLVFLPAGIYMFYGIARLIRGGG